MEKMIEPILKRGLPFLMALLAAIFLILGSFHVTYSSSAGFNEDPIQTNAFDVGVGVALLAISIVIWFIDSSRIHRDAESALNGHSALIAFLNDFVRAREFRPPSLYAGQFKPDSAVRYATMYLESLGLLQKNESASEYRSTKKAEKILASPTFIAKNRNAMADTQNAR